MVAHSLSSGSPCNKGRPPRTALQVLLEVTPAPGSRTLAPRDAAVNDPGSRRTHGILHRPHRGPLLVPAIARIILSTRRPPKITDFLRLFRGIFARNRDYIYGAIAIA